MLFAVACSPQDDNSSSGDSTASQDSNGGTPVDACADAQTLKPGILTIATDDPVFEPWMYDNDPTNGKGFESAVAYAVAHKMGFSKRRGDVDTVPFNASYQPGPKEFDFDINQISINPQAGGGRRRSPTATTP